MTFHCFFEQSGTFKNEFKKLGYEAYDYDILDDFGETDYQVDLFKEIEVAYKRERERDNGLRQREGRRSNHRLLPMCSIRESNHASLQRTVLWNQRLQHGAENGILNEDNGRIERYVYACQ